MVLSDIFEQRRSFMSEVRYSDIPDRGIEMNFYVKLINHAYMQ